MKVVSNVRISAIVGAYDMVLGCAKTVKGLQRRLKEAESLHANAVIVEGDLHGCEFLSTMTIAAARQIFAAV